MKENSIPGFHPVALFFWVTTIPVLGALIYLLKYKQSVVDDIVVNMIDVAKRQASSIRCSTKWPTFTTKKSPC